MKSEPLEEPKDRTKLVWAGVIVFFIFAVVALWAIDSKQADVTQVRAKHILVKCKKNDPVDRARAVELINDLHARLLKGESFSKLARDYSDDEMSAARGGDLGYYPKNSFDPAFEEYVWSAPVGKVSDVIQSAYGFHIIVVVDRNVSKADQYEMDLEKKVKDSTPAESGTTPKQPK